MIDPNNQYTKMQQQLYDSEVDLMDKNDHQSHNNNPEYWSKLLADVKDNQMVGKTALDFGCGTGRNTRNLFAMGFKQIYGCDMCAGNLDNARRRVVAQGMNNIKYWQTNGVGLEPPDWKLRNAYVQYKFDFVMSTIVFQHIPVHSIRYTIWEHIHRAMKTNGIFSFQMGFGPPKGTLPKSAYYDDCFDAQTTNSQHDVWVDNSEQIIDDLMKIGFNEVTSQIGEAWEDSHPQWIYIRAIK